MRHRCTLSLHLCNDGKRRSFLRFPKWLSLLHFWKWAAQDSNLRLPPCEERTKNVLSAEMPYQITV